ncbi:hypothetical protein QIX46_08060 [Lysinibacillus boronitolerans]|nr:hypothetical protein QIX46_08060 [Lysinibacillus boronitolerans]
MKRIYLWKKERPIKLSFLKAGKIRLLQTSSNRGNTAIMFDLVEEPHDLQ